MVFYVILTKDLEMKQCVSLWKNIKKEVPTAFLIIDFCVNFKNENVNRKSRK